MDCPFEGKHCWSDIDISGFTNARRELYAAEKEAKECATAKDAAINKAKTAKEAADLCAKEKGIAINECATEMANAKKEVAEARKEAAKAKEEADKAKKEATKCA